MISGKYKEVLELLTNSGDDEAELDSKILIEELEGEALTDAARRRANGEPLALILGHRHFYREDYSVKQGVLIPRADTEILVECALRFCGALDLAFGDVAKIPSPEATFDKVSFMDLCTGTGCVGISIYNGLVAAGVKATATLTDISPTALELARENIVRNCKTEYKPIVVTHNILNDELNVDKLNLIVSNPPYITDSEMEELDRTVSDYEPELALRGGQDGLNFYKVILKKAYDALDIGGGAIVEHGYMQGECVRNLFTEFGFEDVVTIKDYGGLDRVTFGRKNAL